MDYLTPILNGELIINKEGELICGYNSMHADFLWMKRKVTGEYNSNLYHLTAKAYSADINRKLAQEISGYMCIVISAEDVNSFMNLEKKMEVLKKALRSRGKSELRDNYYIKRHLVYEKLFKQ